MTRKRRKTRSRSARLAVTLRGSLGAFRAQMRRLEARLQRDMLLWGSSFVHVFSDGKRARVRPFTEEEFNETARAIEIVRREKPWWLGPSE